jgi:hypothetical protein
MQSSPLANVSLQQLKQAIAIREKIDALEKELSRIIGGQASTAKAGAPPRKRKMSAAARAKISAAAKARWAKFRAKKAKK